MTTTEAPQVHTVSIRTEQVEYPHYVYTVVCECGWYREVGTRRFPTLVQAERQEEAEILAREAGMDHLYEAVEDYETCGFCGERIAEDDDDAFTPECVHETSHHDCHTEYCPTPKSCYAE